MLQTKAVRVTITKLQYIYIYIYIYEILEQKSNILEKLVSLLENTTNYYRICFNEVMGFLEISTSLHTRLAAKMYLGDRVLTGNRKHAGPQIMKNSDNRDIQMRWATFQPQQTDDYDGEL